MHLRLEQHIDAPAAVVWNVLGPQFAEIAEWSTFVTSSRALDPNDVPSSMVVPPGAPVHGRVTATKATVTEVLTAYSDEHHTLTFEGVGLPRVITLARDTQSVEPDGPDASTVVFEIEFRFAGPFAVFSPIVKRRMAATFTDLLLDLKHHVESEVAPPTDGTMADRAANTGDLS